MLEGISVAVTKAWLGMKGAEPGWGMQGRAERHWVTPKAWGESCAAAAHRDAARRWSLG